MLKGLVDTVVRRTERTTGRVPKIGSSGLRLPSEGAVKVCPARTTRRFPGTGSAEIRRPGAEVEHRIG